MPSVVSHLKSAGTRSATWLAEVPLETDGATLTQADFAALPEGDLKSLLTADYASSNEMADAFARAGFIVSVNLFYAPAGWQTGRWQYEWIGGKPQITTFYFFGVTPTVFATTKLSIAYSASR